MAIESVLDTLFDQAGEENHATISRSSGACGKRPHQFSEGAPPVPSSTGLM